MSEQRIKIHFSQNGHLRLIKGDKGHVKPVRKQRSRPAGKRICFAAILVLINVAQLFAGMIGSVKSAVLSYMNRYAGLITASVKNEKTGASVNTMA